MNFKNSSTYIQKQIDKLLHLHRKYVKVYVDDIIIFFKTKKNIKLIYELFFFRF